MALLLSDQTFPAALPCKNGECAKIFRIEDGTLNELIGVWLEITKGKKITAGSVVVIFSSTHLLMEGLEGYAEVQVKVLNRMDRIFYGGIITIPGIPVFMGGCDSPDLIRDLWGMLGWLKDIEELKLWRGWYELVGSLVGGGKGGCSPPDVPNSGCLTVFIPLLLALGLAPEAQQFTIRCLRSRQSWRKESSMAFCQI
jgi:hypothetical protein